MSKIIWVQGSLHFLLFIDRFILQCGSFIDDVFRDLQRTPTDEVKVFQDL